MPDSQLHSQLASHPDFRPGNAFSSVKAEATRDQRARMRATER
jgi:hypothetical protein